MSDHPLPIIDPLAFGMHPELPEAFDHSFTGTYLECERMAYYQNILGRRYTYSTDMSLYWGNLFHKLTQTWVDAKTQEEGIAEVTKVIDLNLEDETEDRYGRNRLRMQELFIEWVKFREKQPLEILFSEQPVHIECPKGHPCPYSPDGCGLSYGGRIDLIVRWNQLVGPLDYKTTVMNESDPLVEYKPSHQMLGYTWATTHLTGKLCWGVIVERLICNKSKIDINRFPVSLSNGLVLEWIDNEIRTHAEIRQKFAEYPRDERAWKQNMGRCAKPYMCKFRDVCTAPRDAGFRYKWLRDNTVEQRFDFRKEQLREAAKPDTDGN